MDHGDFKFCWGAIVVVEATLDVMEVDVVLLSMYGEDFRLILYDTLYFFCTIRNNMVLASPFL